MKRTLSLLAALLMVAAAACQDVTRPIPQAPSFTTSDSTMTTTESTDTTTERGGPVIGSGG